MSTISNSGVYEIDCMLAGPAFRWNAYTPYGSGITLTYSFPTSIPSYYQDGSISQFHAFNDYWKQLTRIVLTKYQSVADITFIEVDESVSSGGQIRFSFEDTERGGYAYYPNELTDGVLHRAGDVWINFRYADNAPVWSYRTLLHEVGHALGLKHPGNYQSTDFAPFLPDWQDDIYHTIMSYNDGSNMLPELGIFDIQALHFLYGAKSPTSIGNLRYGDDGANLMSGGNGFDYLHGLGGNDSLIGGSGNDMLGGEDGNDWMQGDDGNDLLVSNKGNDTLMGGIGVDTLYGGQGDDSIAGGHGNDWLYGNLGSDNVYGGDGIDIVFGGQGNDTISGGDANDMIFGNSDDDVLYGDAGNDRLEGGPGSDTLVGGDGIDYIRFESDSGIDVVLGFNSRMDYIVVAQNANGVGFASSNDVYARVSEGALGAVIDLGGGNSIIIAGVQKSELAAWNFAIW